MDRQSLNPVAAGFGSAPFSNRITAVSEQDQYANAHLGRALANTQSHTAHCKDPEWNIFFPDSTFDIAGNLMTMYQAVRHSS
jgi:hypothetical protein